MHEPLRAAELEKLQQEEPTAEAKAMTRQEKLLRWAELVRAVSHQLYIFSNLERWNPGDLAAATQPESAFQIAADDPVFRAAGLNGNTPAAAMNFFELSLRDLHEFSCDCGGHISNEAMASRIASIAKPSMMDRARSALGMGAGI